MGARAQIERDASGERCANCGWWAGRDTPASAALCELHDIKTLDLAKCSEHRADRGAVKGQILEGEE